MPGAIRNDPSLFNKPLIANTVCEFRARINRVRSNDAFSVSCNQSSFDSNDITIQLFFVLFSFSLSIYIYSRVLYMFRIFEEFYLPFESLSYRRQSPRRRKNNRCYDISETERKKNDAAVQHFAVYMCIAKVALWYIHTLKLRHIIPTQISFGRSMQKNKSGSHRYSTFFPFNHTSSKSSLRTPNRTSNSSICIHIYTISSASIMKCNKKP